MLPNYSNGLVIHPVLEMIQASSSNVDTFSFFGRHEEMLSEKMDSNFHMAGASSNNGCATEAAAAAARTKAHPESVCLEEKRKKTYYGYSDSHMHTLSMYHGEI